MFYYQQSVVRDNLVAIKREHNSSLLEVIPSGSNLDDRRSHSCDKIKRAKAASKREQYQIYLNIAEREQVGRA